MMVKEIASFVNMALCKRVHMFQLTCAASYLSGLEPVSLTFINLRGPLNRIRRQIIPNSFGVNMLVREIASFVNKALRKPVHTHNRTCAASYLSGLEPVSLAFINLRGPLNRLRRKSIPNSFGIKKCWSE